MDDVELNDYQMGWSDALAWVLNHIELAPEDEERIEKIIDA